MAQQLQGAVTTGASKHENQKAKIVGDEIVKIVESFGATDLQATVQPTGKTIGELLHNTAKLFDSLAKHGEKEALTKHGIKCGLDETVALALGLDLIEKTKEKYVENKNANTNEIELSNELKQDLKQRIHGVVCVGPTLLKDTRKIAYNSILGTATLSVLKNVANVSAKNEEVKWQDMNDEKKITLSSLLKRNGFVGVTGRHFVDVFDAKLHLPKRNHRQSTIAMSISLNSLSKNSKYSKIIYDWSKDRFRHLLSETQTNGNKKNDKENNDKEKNEYNLYVSEKFDIAIITGKNMCSYLPVLAQLEIGKKEIDSNVMAKSLVIASCWRNEFTDICIKTVEARLRRQSKQSGFFFTSNGLNEGTSGAMCVDYQGRLIGLNCGETAWFGQSLFDVPLCAYPNFVKQELENNGFAVLDQRSSLTKIYSQLAGVVTFTQLSENANDDVFSSSSSLEMVVQEEQEQEYVKASHVFGSPLDPEMIEMWFQERMKKLQEKNRDQFF